MKKLILLSILLFLYSCATKQLQIANNNKPYSKTPSEVAHSFYMLGNTLSQDQVWNALLKDRENTDDPSTLLFLGNSVDNHLDTEKIAYKNTLKFLADFKGNTVFVPGSQEWNTGLGDLKSLQKKIKKQLDDVGFSLENGCPIDKITIGEQIQVIIVDSQWFLNDWDDFPTINDDCDIKSRSDFFDEFGSLIKKARGKTTIVALHHPMFSNGEYGGQYSVKSHMKPLPIIGSLKNILRRTSGAHAADLNSKRYIEFRERLITLAQENKKVIFTSAHEKNLQYLIEDNIPQIISSAGSVLTETKLKKNGLFMYANNGYAKLNVYKNGASHLTFYRLTENNSTEIVYETEIYPKDEAETIPSYTKEFPAKVAASIYTEEETDISGFHKFLWGDRYRKYYSTKVEAPTVNLDTLFGGLIPVRKGGGNQSKSLRLQDKNGAQYVMRALRKNAVQYLQATMFKNKYIDGKFDNTGVEGLILDVFTGSHPYAPFVIGDLADAVDIFHTNPVLYYVPKQNALGSFNADFGDELYMIEEHTSEGHSDTKSFGFQDKIISTGDMMNRIHKDEDISVDESSYIRARLFDMLIGDWDRHQDQWRWIEFKENGQKVYRPLPRDRDQAFSIMSDGFLLGAAVELLPTARILRKYSDDLKDVKGVNVEPYPLDMEIIQQSNKDIWDQQVQLIQAGVTDEVIEKAFLNIPEEVRDETISAIKQKLKSRRKNLQKIADRYYELLTKYVVIKGTNKDDWFEIERLPNKQTKVTAYRIKNGQKGAIFHERVYNREETKEIWIYGLDDDDTFVVKGVNEVNMIKLRLIGGQNKDTYNLEEGRRVIFYDYESKKNSVTTNKGRKKLSDNYETNTYDYKKLKNNTNQLIPTIGFNPDTGFKVGVSNTFSVYGFERNPFTERHIVSAAYFFGVQGYEVNYIGEFANILKGVNFGVKASFNSPNYAINFFGFGNSTPNFQGNDATDEFEADLDYNRVRIRTFDIKPSLIWRGKLGSKFEIGVLYESNEVERTEGRFLDDVVSLEDNLGNPSVDESIFDNQNFFGVEAEYHFINKDQKAFPTLGLEAFVRLGYKNNTSTEKGFGYIAPSLSIDHKLMDSGQLVLASKISSYINIGDDFEFYQGATLGANTGLRGYRNERFTGKRSFSQSTDVRWSFNKIRAGFLPLKFGVYAGFDYGRVWVDDQLAILPQFNDNDWNTSLGGGIFLNMLDMFVGNISVFDSDDGLRFQFRLGFGF